MEDSFVDSPPKDLGTFDNPAPPKRPAKKVSHGIKKDSLKNKIRIEIINITLMPIIKRIRVVRWLALFLGVYIC